MRPDVRFGDLSQEAAKGRLLCAAEQNDIKRSVLQLLFAPREKLEELGSVEGWLTTLPCGS